MEVRMSDLNSERINREDQCNEEIKEFGQFTLSENREQRRIHLLSVIGEIEDRKSTRLNSSH